MPVVDDRVVTNCSLARIEQPANNGRCCHRVDLTGLGMRDALKFVGDLNDPARIRERIVVKQNVARKCAKAPSIKPFVVENVKTNLRSFCVGLP